ncbi:MAG TPA: MauE/DoxX family redox-associated membrane protein [Steroidobacteraceae bacterium]|nr:MauE/DoxX family redox-associated membrane protein [Steroidobacteraceae bacterium]
MATSAVLYRMVTHDHICPFGLKSRALLRARGFEVEDHWLTTREETDAFKAQHGVKTTPQTFIGGDRIGGYDELRRHFGLRVRDPKALSYAPVIAVYALAAVMGLALSFSLTGSPFTPRAAMAFAGIGTTFLALLKLRDLERFTNMFVGYDLLAQRWIGYAYVYPFGEAAAGIAMLSMPLPPLPRWIGAALALVLGTIGAVSVIKAVYIDRRSIRCACVGGDSNVPLGFVSLTENVLMVAMGLWMLA